MLSIMALVHPISQTQLIVIHTGDRDVSRTDEENQSLCLTFSDLFTTKIRLLNDFIASTLYTLV